MAKSPRDKRENISAESDQRGFSTHRGLVYLLVSQSPRSLASAAMVFLDTFDAWEGGNCLSEERRLLLYIQTWSLWFILEEVTYILRNNHPIIILWKTNLSPIWNYGFEDEL